jgi:hypothetical protein
MEPVTTTNFALHSGMTRQNRKWRYAQNASQTKFLRRWANQVKVLAATIVAVLFAENPSK